MGEYIVGCDIASGGGGDGSSNSTITVLNRRTGQKVFAFASPAILPYDLASLAIAVCKWFANYRGDPAFLIWEANGPGGAEFKVRVELSRFYNFYRRKPKDSSLHARDTDKAGYWTGKKSEFLGPYREALLEGYFDNPDQDAIEELRQYQRDQNGEPYHVGEKSKTDSAGAGAAHGDRTISDGLTWYASLTFGDQMKSSARRNKPTVMNVREDEVSRDSFAWRRAQYLRMRNAQRKKPNW
jgi:hypothetical protein